MKHIIPYSNWKLNEADSPSPIQLDPSKIYNGRLPQSLLVDIGHSGHKLNSQAAADYKRMRSAAAAEGISWGITDSYRRYEIQNNIFDWGHYRSTGVRRKVGTSGTPVAYPGTSNHGLGSAVDLIVKKGDRAHTWLTNNASRFGFTPFLKEPWHWDHKGSAAEIMKMPNFVAITPSKTGGPLLGSVGAQGASSLNQSGKSTMTRQELVNWIIDNIERGYYSPELHGKMLASGETMMGIDRANSPKWGETPAGKQFWSLVDANKGAWIENALKQKNPHLTRSYLGGPVEGQLKQLVAGIVLGEYTKWLDQLLGDKYKQYVIGYAPLELHFIYAVWNGYGWFGWFASIIKTAVDSGITNRVELFKKSIDDRLDCKKPGVGTASKKILKGSGTKMMNFFKQEYDKGSKI